MKRFLATIGVLLAWEASAQAQTYTVCPAGPPTCTYATIGACLSVAQPGYTCDVYSGDYTSAGIISSVRDGTSNTARITVSVHTGQTATVRGFAITHNWHTISGFTVNTGSTSSFGVQVTYATGVIFENSTVTAQRNSCVRFGNSAGDVPSNYIIRNNTVQYCGELLTGFSSGSGIESYGSDALVDGNEIHHANDDCIKASGSNVVIRNNYCHDMAPINADGYNTAHIDLLHNGTIALSNVLVEGNVYRNVDDATGNCHGTWLETPGMTQIILRYNYNDNIDDSVTPQFAIPYSYNYQYLYNNTFGAGALASEGFCTYIPSGYRYSKFKNNICSNSNSVSSTIPIRMSDATHESDGNIIHRVGYSGSWTGQYSTESTYAALRNQNPGFTNYPTSAAIGSTSPARDAGVALTTVAAADSGSGTSLVLTDARYFFDGEGLVNADQIRISTGTYATIASINYATNTITLTAGVSRSDGDPVYLYKKSDGDIVLVGPLPDVGAYEYGAGAAVPAAPTNVRIR